MASIFRMRLKLCADHFPSVWLCAQLNRHCCMDMCDCSNKVLFRLHVCLANVYTNSKDAIKSNQLGPALPEHFCNNSRDSTSHCLCACWNRDGNVPPAILPLLYARKNALDEMMSVTPYQRKFIQVGQISSASEICRQKVKEKDRV